MINNKITAKYIFTLAVLLIPVISYSQGNLKPTLEKYRKEYKSPLTKEQLGIILNKTAWEHRKDGWALLGKKTGSNCLSPDKVLISCDFLLHISTLNGYDVFIDAEGKATPTWNGPHNMINSIMNGSRSIVLPTGMDVIIPPTPDDRDKRIKELEAYARQLEESNKKLIVEVLELKNRPIPIPSTSSVSTCIIQPSWVTRFGISCIVK